jgi:hypothetical protein
VVGGELGDNRTDSVIGTLFCAVVTFCEDDSLPLLLYFVRARGSTHHLILIKSIARQRRHYEAFIAVTNCSAAKGSDNGMNDFLVIPCDSGR